jgi:lipopolysaccharide export system ATP-binding protein
MALLEVHGLVKYYGRRKVVDGVHFDVNPGEVVGLLGPNGAGKTTSFRMATGQVAPNGGTVWFDGRDVTDLPMFRRARLGMGYLSQEQSIFRKLTVEKNLLAILEALPRSRTLGRRLTRSERWERTEQALAQFNLTTVRRNVAARCSGGEKRRLEIARCLVCEPQLILLDEPFAAVDPKTTQDIRDNVRQLADRGIGILLTDHNVREVVKTADRIYLIVDGKVVCHGTPEQLIKDPVAIDAYLGTTFEDDVLMKRVAGMVAGTTAGPKPAPVAAVSPPPPAAPPPAPPAPAARVLPIDDRIPKSIATAPRLPDPAPAPAPKLSATAQGLIAQERFRRLVDRLADRSTMADAWHELAAAGDPAVPVLLEGLERRDLETRHLSAKLLEAVLGEPVAFRADAPDDERLRQVAHLRAKYRDRG